MLLTLETKWFWIFELNKTPNTYHLCEYNLDMKQSVTRLNINHHVNISECSRTAYDFNNNLYLSEADQNLIHLYNTRYRQYIG